MAGFDCEQGYHEALSCSLSEIRDYVDIIYTYSCKLCDFSSGSVDAIWHHVVESHLQSANTLDPGGVPVSSICDSKCTASGAEVLVESTNASCDSVKSLGSFDPPSSIRSTQCVSSELNIGANSQWKTADVCSVINSKSSPEETNLNQEQIVFENHITELGVVSVEDRYLHHVQSEEQPCSQVSEVAVTGDGDFGSSSNTESKNNSVKEIFICSSCGTGFTSSGVMEHMITVHGMKIESLGDEVVENHNIAAEHTHFIPPTFSPSDFHMPPNVTSTGTQVQLVKKPGRKRKVVCKSKVLTSEIANIPDNINNSESENVKAIKALGIERVVDEKNINSRISKRQIRPPRMLVKDYHIVFHKHWKRHSAPADNVQKIHCQVVGCDAIFNSDEDLAYHSKCHVANSEAVLRYTCPECRRPCQSWNKLRTHIQAVHNITVDWFDCGGCDFRSETASLLEEHNMAVHSGEVVPNVKGKTRSRSKLSHHPTVRKSVCNSQQVSSHVENECILCKRSFANRKSLNAHTEVVHGKNKMFMCSICGYNSARKATLQLHMRIHTGEKPYRCDVCTFTASDHNTLRRHRMRHTGQKAYGCSFCTYTCIQAASLKLHIRSKHPGAAVQPGLADGGAVLPSSTTTTVYTCAICLYQTVNLRNYQSHVTSHGGESSLEVHNSENLDVATGDQDDVTRSSSSTQVKANELTSQTEVVATSYPLCAEFSSPAISAPNSNVYTVLSYQIAVASNKHVYGTVLPLEGEEV